MLVAFIIFGILNYLQNKKINKTSINIVQLLDKPTAENIAEAKKEAKYITAKTDGTISLPASLNVARVKALKESPSNPNKTTKE